LHIAYLLPYRLPTSYVLMPETPSDAVWAEAWRDARGNIAILAGALIVLTLIFVFQDRLARSRLTHRLVRMSFLAFVLVWLGWIAGAQLSILHVTTWLRALVSGADAGAYLMEPLIGIIALYTLVSLILIGRGVFCGWLCPFGAVQELLAQAARAVGVPQWQPSSRVAWQLRFCKYVAAALLIGLAVLSVRATNTVAEIEPFKTAITAKFARAWPYVAYAAGILAIGLFTERAFCRFFCPLGGVLAALDRFHLLDRLRRRAECGSPCHLCEVACPVGAIENSGRIVTAECFQCLDCQVVYFDDHRCPPLVAARRLHQRNALGA
jgi:NosR/NirI family transcriptional regulator, nitrous oxide reductase regulator